MPETQETTEARPNHTPAPWHVRKTNTGTFIAGPRPGDPGYFVQMIGGMVARESREADARLIAAAPEMLAALRLVRAQWTGCRTNDLSDNLADEKRMRDAVDAALAKADPCPF